MTDPFSIAAGIAGIVSLSGHVFHGINSFQKKAGGAHSAVTELSKQTRNLSGVLQNLSLLAASLEDECKSDRTNVSFRAQQVNACRQTLHRIETRLKKAQDDFATGSKRRAVSRSLKWPFSVEETRELLDEMAHHQRTLELALSADTMVTLMQCLAKQDAVEDSVGKLRDTIERKFSIDARVELDKERAKVVKFFLRINPQLSFQTCLNLRQPMTGLWLTEGNPAFGRWKNGHNAKLLLSGIPGAGKTVLCGSVIEEVLQDSSANVAVAFFFCDYKNEKSQETINILSVLAAQLAQQSDDAFELLEAYYGALHPKKRLDKEPSTSDLVEVFQKMASVYDKVFIVIDGLDECGANVRDVLRSLKKLTRTSPSVSMALFSRDEPEVREELADEFDHVEIAAHTEDLELYVRAEMANRNQLSTLAVTNPTLDEEIRQALINGAKGMFRWVACQLDHLCDLPTNRARRKALEELPPTLFETYDRILERLLSTSVEVRKIVQKALYWIGLGLYLTVDQLCEAVSVPDDVDEMDADDVVSESVITYRCSSLVRRSLNGDALEFAHFTVLEYLQRIDASSPLSFFRFTKERAASSCLSTAFRFLTFAEFERRPVALPSEKGVIEERSEAHPFYRRAAGMFLGGGMGVLEREAFAELLRDPAFFRYAEKMFGPGKPGIFLSWVLEDTQTWTAIGVVELVTRFLRPGFTPLHVAAGLSQPAICRFLLERGGADASSNCELGTPLHFALGGPTMIRCCSAVSPGNALNWMYKFSYASRPGDTGATISLLLDHGADPSRTWRSTSALAAAIGMSIRRRDFEMLVPFLRPATPVPDDALRLLENMERFWMWEFNEEFLDGVLSRVSRAGPSSSLSRLLPSLLRASRRVNATVASLPKAMRHVADMSDEEILAAMTAAAQFDLGEDLKTLVEYVISARRDRALRAGKTPMLHFAAAQNSTGAVAALLSCGFDVDTTDADGQTALDVCCERGHLETAEVLLKKGARTVGGAGKQGRGTWHIAAHYNNTELLSLLFLYDKGSAQSLAALSNDGNTPLACAVLAGAADAARLILDRCWEPLHQELFQSNIPLLHAAAGFGDQDLFCRLLDTGVTLRETSGDGSTPLHYLQPSSPASFVDYLLSRYDHLQPQDDGRIPLELVLSRLEDRPGDRPEAVDAEIVRRMLPPDHILPRAGAEGLHLWEFFCSEVVPRFNSPCSNHRDAGSDYSDTSSEYSEPSNGSSDAVGSEGIELGRKRFRESECSGKMICSAADVLIGCGVLASYEVRSGTPAFEPLFSALLARSPSPLRVESTLSCAWVVPVVEAVLGATTLPKKEARSATHGRLLTEAIQAKIPPLVEALLQYHADVHSDIHPDLGPDSPIEAACSTADLATFQAVLQHVDRDRIDEARPHGAPLLFWIWQGPGPQKVQKTRALLQLGADPNATATSTHGKPMSLVSVVAQGGHFDAVKLLHEKGADLYGEHAGFTVATAAASRGNIAVLRKLQRGDAPPGYWEKKSDLLSKDREGTMQPLGDGCSLLHAAAANRDGRMVHYLMDQGLGIDVDAVSAYGLAPLHVAAMCGAAPVARALLGHGAAVNVRDKAGYLPLDRALCVPDYGMARVLIEAGSMPTSFARLKAPQALVLGSMKAPAGRPWRPAQRAVDLECAIIAGDLKVCRDVINEGLSVDVMLPPCQACPPLFTAVKANKPDIISWLMSRGASPDNISCRHVPGPLSSLASLATYHLASMECLEQLLTYVLDRGLDAFAWPYNPLHVAVLNGNVTTLKTIIRHIRSHEKAYRRTNGFEATGSCAVAPEPLLVHLINMKQGLLCDSSGHIGLPWLPPPPGDTEPRGTPLHISSFWGPSAAVEVLIEAGADVNAVDQFGRSPLTIAAQRGFREIAALLLDAGAHLNHRSSCTFTPLMEAARKGNLAMVELLHRQGADLLAADENGATALDLAADEPGRPDVFAYLLSKGVPLGKNVYGVNTAERALRQPSLRSIVFHSGLVRVHAESLEQLLSHVIWTFYDQSSFVKKFYRALPEPVAWRLTNMRPKLWWSPLCIAAAVNEVASARMLLDNGADIDLEGSPEGSPLMAACSLGHLDTVRLLIRMGAKLEYISDGGEYRNALVSMKQHPHLIRWFLVERFREQRGLQLCPSREDAEVKPWAGVRSFRYRLPRDLWQRHDESMIEVLRRRQAFRERIRGKVVR